MKIFTIKGMYSLNNIVAGIIFFLLITLLCNIYSLGYSPLIIAIIIFLYIRFSRQEQDINFPSYIDLAILGAIAFLLALITTSYFKLSAYAIPSIGLGILVAVLFNNLKLSFLAVLLISWLGASIEGASLNVGTSLFAGGFLAAVLSQGVRRRETVIRAGVIAGIVQFIIAIFLESWDELLLFSPLNKNLFITCFLNGAISSIVILGVLPFFEYLFRVVTNVSLLELSDFNHPLMRRLILEAPGTYQHSLAVANLSEAAAEAIGANSLLARVGSYYHDIGKLDKPQYFGENQISFKDAHKDLKPSMSKLIIINHVKEGLEFAKQCRLSPRIIDFIMQHHGKTLVYYFYHRAKELEPEGEHEEEYRYPGPKPQSKEIAIVSLADTVEALSRTLEEPTPSRIEEMIRDVVKKRFREGELDESNLTLKDLEKVTQSFVRTINAFFHTRINYPKDEEKDKFNKPTNGKKNKP